MVKHRLVTKQTPPEGVEVQKVLSLISGIQLDSLFQLGYGC
jgi:hypothetical protein